jgi:hypothetical protein
MRASVIAPKDEVENDEGYYDAEDTRQGKIKPVLHHQEGEQAFKHLVETWSVPPRDQPKTPLDEARQAIPQQGRESKHQPRCHIKTFDPRARARDQDRKQVASPGFGRSQQGASIEKTRSTIQGRGKTVPYQPLPYDGRQICNDDQEQQLEVNRFQVKPPLNSVSLV